VVNAVPCRQVAGLFTRPPISVAKSADPWAVELVGSSSDSTALAAYRQLQEKHASILADREPRVVHRGLARGSMGWARVHVGAESRASAEKVCADLRAAGASCWVATQLKRARSEQQSTRCGNPPCRAALRKALPRILFVLQFRHLNHSPSSNASCRRSSEFLIILFQIPKRQGGDHEQT